MLDYRCGSDSRSDDEKRKTNRTNTRNSPGGPRKAGTVNIRVTPIGSGTLRTAKVIIEERLWEIKIKEKLRHMNTNANTREWADKRITCNLIADDV